jgi:hypothetical protein
MRRVAFTFAFFALVYPLIAFLTRGVFGAGGAGCVGGRSPVN